MSFCMEVIDHREKFSRLSFTGLIILCTIFAFLNLMNIKGFMLKLALPPFKRKANQASMNLATSFEVHYSLEQITFCE